MTATVLPRSHSKSSPASAVAAPKEAFKSCLNAENRVEGFILGSQGFQNVLSGRPRVTSIWPGWVKGSMLSDVGREEGEHREARSAEREDLEREL